jgi:hypothetical protein
MAETNEAEGHGAPIIIGRVAAEVTLTSLQPKNLPGGLGEEGEIHTISSDKPPKLHGKVVMDAETSSTAEMPPGCARRAGG